MSDWLLVAPEKALFIFMSIALSYFALVVLTRVAGIRSFSKMSGFDFAVTVAIGSVFASIIMSKDPSVGQGVLALTGLFTFQIAFAFLRSRFTWVQDLADNKPRLIMIGKDIQYDQLKKAKMTESDLRGKLREANVINYSQIRAVIAETTGDVCVLHCTDNDVKLSKELFEGVIEAERITG